LSNKESTLVDGDDEETKRAWFDFVEFAREQDRRARSGELEAVPSAKPATQSAERPMSSHRPHAPGEPELPEARWASIPSMAVSEDALKGYFLDSRSAYLVSLIDGAMDLELLYAVSGMQPQELLLRIRDLVDLGILRLR
jgi:hypothetical protein